jgi:hypothetical protein
MSKRILQHNVQITWYGDEFVKLVEKYGDEALFAAGQRVLDAAVRRAPRRTGMLAGSGYISTATKSTYERHYGWRREIKPLKGGVIIGFSAPHAHLIEAGRRKGGDIKPRKKTLKIGDSFVARSRFRRMAARPFLGPAVDETRETMVEDLAAVLREKLEQHMPR